MYQVLVCSGVASCGTLHGARAALDFQQFILFCFTLGLYKYTHTHTHPFNGPLSRITPVSRYQKGETNLDFTEARDSEWQWHQLGRMQVCTSLQTDNHASTPPLSFLQAGCPSCHPTNSVKALKAIWGCTKYGGNFSCEISSRFAYHSY